MEDTPFHWLSMYTLDSITCQQGGGEIYSIEVKHEFLHFPHFYIVDEKEEEDISSYIHKKKMKENELYLMPRGNGCVLTAEQRS